MDSGFNLPHSGTSKLIEVGDLAVQPCAERPTPNASESRPGSQGVPRRRCVRRPHCHREILTMRICGGLGVALPACRSSGTKVPNSGGSLRMPVVMQQDSQGKWKQDGPGIEQPGDTGTRSGKSRPLPRPAAALAGSSRGGSSVCRRQHPPRHLRNAWNLEDLSLPLPRPNAAFALVGQGPGA